MPVIPPLRKQRQEDGGIKASMNYIESSRPAWAALRDYFQKKKKKKTWA
jgi:hypothetical protein